MILQFVIAHHTAISLAALWLFSAACSAMPPLREDAGYYTTWAHDLLQAMAANLGKLKQQPKI